MSANRAKPPAVWPTGNGEMASHIRNFDWAPTSVGPIEGWPPPLRTAVDLALASPVAAIVLWGPDLLQIYNNLWSKLHPGRHPAGLGQRTRECFPELLDALDPIYDRVLQGEGIVLEDVLLPVRRQGSTEDAWWNVAYTPIRTESGSIEGIYCTLAETTARVDRTRTEAALRQSEAKFRTLFDSIDEGFCIIEVLFDQNDQPYNYRFLEANPAFVKQTGLRDALGKTVLELIPSQEKFWFEIYGEIVRTGKARRFEHESPAQGRWYDVYAFRTGSPEQPHVAVVFTDVSERKRAEGQLREEQSRQSFLLRLSDTIRALSDPNAIADTVTRMVAEHFQVDRCFISRISKDQGKAWVEHETRKPGLMSAEGEVNLADFPEVMRIAETKTMVFGDVQSHPALSERDKAAVGGLGLGAFIAAVLRRGERNYVWDLVIASTEPRNWSPGEALLLEEIAERAWLGIERARAEKELERNENELRAFTSATNDAVYRMSPDWAEMSQLAGRSFLQNTEAPDPNWLTRYIHPDDQPGVLAAIDNAIRTRSHFEMEHRVVRADGSIGWTFSRAIPVFDSAGKITGWFGAAKDITDRLEAEKARFRLAAIVNSAEDAIVGKNLDGTVTSWNPAASHLFGYSAEEMIGQSIRKVIPDELQSEEDAILRKLSVGEHVAHFETRRLRKDGQLINVAITVSPVFDDTGKVIGASKIARDISERIKVQRLLVQAEKIAASGKMAATVAHELNNPLEAVLNLIYLARQSSIDNPEAASYLKSAEVELQRAAHISKQALGYYRNTSKPVRFALSAALDELLKVYAPRLQNASIGVNRSYRGADTILANLGEVQQAFANMIANAIDAMPQGGTLDLGIADTEKDGTQRVLVTIADTGTGITAEHLSRLFEPFFTTKGDRGNGIGLWISKEAVEKNGGTIAVESVAYGKKTGTTLSLVFPLADG
jgi:PAS domain S-box-containing protein